MSYLKFHLFGLPQFERDGNLLNINRRKSLALAAYLILTRKPQSRDTLAALLWPGYDQNTARSSLRTTLWELKKQFGPELLKIEREQVVAEGHQGLWVDVTEFRDLLTVSKGHDHCGKEICPECAARLTRAAVLYRGAFMAGFSLSGAQPFEDWKKIQSKELDYDLIWALQNLVDFHDSKTDYDQAVDYARYWLKLEPRDESAHERLMRLFVKMEQPGAALCQYEECARILAEGLKTEPREHLQNFFREIKNRCCLSTAAVSSHAASIPSGPCIGREKELQEIARLLTDPSCRLLTLTGWGGIGKTTLAQHALKENGAQFRQGAYFIPLAHIKSADMIVPLVAETLILSFRNEGDFQQQLIQYIGDKSILLVMDSYEHLLEGAEILSAFLNQTLHLKLLITSRQRLNLKQEWVFNVQGLDYAKNTDEKDIEGYSAVRLFLQSARRVQPEFSLAEADKPYVNLICRFLDGMPLGLELAATWVRVLSCREISLEIERDVGFLNTDLSDIPERHRSLQAVFDYSWQLLLEEERTVLARLCIFQGGFEKEAAEEITGMPLAVLSVLINKHFIRRTSAGRFEILEAMRQFIKEQARRGHENWEEIQTCHADYYAKFIAQRDQPVKRFRYKEALDDIHREIENIRAGWQWSVLNKRANLIDRYLETLFSYYELCGLYFYAEDALSKMVIVLQYSDDELNALKTVIGKALSLQGWLNHILTHFQKAEKLLQTSISIFERFNLKKELATAFFRLGHICYDTGQLREAEDLMQRSIAIFKAIDSRDDMWEPLKNLANIHLVSGQYAEADALYEQCLAAYQRTGNRYRAGGIFLNKGILLEAQGLYAEAEPFYQESILCFLEAGDRLRLSICYAELGYVFLFMERDQEAENYFKKSLEIVMKLNAKYHGQGSILGLAVLRWKQRHDENVFGLIGRMLTDPFTYMWFRKRIQKILDLLRPQITEERLKTVFNQGKFKEFDHYCGYYQA